MTLDTQQQKPKLTKKRGARLLKGLLATVLCLVITLVGLLHVPYVQNALFRKLLQHLSRKTQCAMTHQDFRWRWGQPMALQGLVIKDPHDHDMVAVAQLTLQVAPWQWLVSRHLHLPAVRVQGASIHLRKEDETGYNVALLLQRLLGDTKSSRAAPRAAPTWSVQSLSVQDGTVAINDCTKVPQPGALDFYHMTLHQLHVELAHLRVQDNALCVDIQHLAGQAADAPIAIQHLATVLRIAPDCVQGQALCLQTNHSHLQGDFTLTDDATESTKPFYERAHLVAHIAEAALASEEVRHWVPCLQQPVTTYTLQGQLEGTLGDCHGRDLQLTFGQQRSHLQGHIALQGLPNVQHTTVSLALEESTCAAKDLLPYLDEKSALLLQPFGWLKAQGHLHGQNNTWTVQAQVDTDLGHITTHVVGRQDAAHPNVTYQGHLAVRDLALGTLLRNQAVQQLTMQGELRGQGLSLDTLCCHLKADIAQLGLQEQVYTNMRLDGDLARAFFRGKLQINDPHLKLQATTTINLKEGEEQLVVQGNLDRASLKGLQLMDQAVQVRAEVAMHMQGLPWQQPRIETQLRQLGLDYAGKTLQLEALQLCAGPQAGRYVLALDTDLLALKAEGSGAYATLPADFQRLLQNYQRHWMHAPLEAPEAVAEPYTLTYQIHCKDINPLLQVWTDEVYVAPGTHIQGSFARDEATTLALRLTEASQLAFRHYQWAHTELDLRASQAQDGQALAAQMHLTSATQQWSPLHATEGLVLDLTCDQQQLRFSGTLEEKRGQHQVALQGQAVWLEDAIEVVLLPSTLRLANQLWYLPPENRIIWGTSWIKFEHCSLTQGQQQIDLMGTLSARPEDVLQLQVQRLALDPLAIAAGQPLQGELNASIALRGLPIRPQVEGEMTVQGLTIDQVLVGDLCARTHWDSAIQQLHLAGYVHSLQKQCLALEGTYTPANAAHSLQLTVQLAQAPLKLLAPWVKDHVRQLVGALQGTLYVQGSPFHPQLTGDVHIVEGAATVSALNTRYRFDGTLQCTPEAIHITSLQLQDEQQGAAMLEGKLLHQQWQDFQLNLAGHLMRLKVLDTTAEDNEQFYGTGIVSGDLLLSGPIDHLAAHLKATTEAGTSVYIPLGASHNTVKQASFIRFVRFEKRQQSTNAPQQVPLKGLQLTLALTVTPDAQVELPLRTGPEDRINGCGNGYLTIHMDTLGALSLAGNFTFVHGAYQFSLFQVAKKTFQVVPGSQVTWHDRPEQGLLDVQATLAQRAALGPLFDEAGVGNAKSLARRKHPVQVHVALQGPLLAPEVHYRIDFPEPPADPSAQRAIKRFQQKTQEDERYLTSQLMSLVLFKRFFEADLQSKGDELALQSAGDLAAQQLNNWTANWDTRLEVDTDVDLTELEQSGMARLNLRLSYSLFDGRLRISREGGLGIHPQDQASLGQLMGDWTVEYLLNEDGSLKAKFYSKRMNRPNRGTQGADVSTSGLGLSYTKGFNHWRALTRTKKRKASS